jgi:hypothetical protein
MNGFSEQFGNIAESGFDPFSLHRDKIFQVLMVRTPGLSLSRSMQANTIIIKHFSML